MSLTIFYGLLTLAPLALGVALAALGLARRATPVVGVALAVIGVLLPVVGLAWLVAEVSAGYPLEIALWGPPTAWLAISARADALSVYAGLGVAALVTPLLLWVAWRAAPPDNTEATELAADEPAVDESAADESEAAEAEAEEAPAAPVAGGLVMGRWQWAGVALALGLESFLLSLVFAENIGWLALAWLLVIVASWALGELGSQPEALDWKGLALMAAPVVIWLVPVLLVAGPAGDRRLIDLMGESKFPIGHVFVMTLAIALAAGAWPALGWVRKRASIATPAGLGAAALAVMPAALIVGARTFSLAQTLSSGWPAFVIGKPPVTIGVLLALLGALTVLFAGLLALGRRDGRGLLASCALAVAGWGLLGLGAGSPLAALGVTLLLATSTLGLGAMLASLVGSGAITADTEPDSAGPRVFGERPRPAALFAWIVGAVTAVGLPLFAGFAPLQIISAASLPGARVVIPLVGLAWGGAALLLIGLLRATAPAFTAAPAEPANALDAADAASDQDEDGGAEPDADAEAEADAEADAEEEEADEALAVGPMDGAADGQELRAADLPGVALGTLALIAGVAPSALLLVGSVPAAESFLQPGALDGATLAQAAGYTAGASQWLATPAGVTVVVVALALAVIRWRLPRATRPAPLYLSGQVAEEPLEGESAALELSGLAEPASAWDDLVPSLRSEWMTPGADWIGVSDEEAPALEAGADEENEEDADTLSDEESADEVSDAASAEEPEPAVAAEEPEPAVAAAETVAVASDAGAEPDEEPSQEERAANGQGARKARGAKRGKR